MRAGGWCVVALVLVGCGGSARQTEDSTPKADPADVCGNRTSGTPSWIVVTADQRYRPDVERFSEVESSLDAPVETCEARGQAEYLLALRCDDGSAPFSSLEEAAAARSGNVGAGGRCGNVIDHYRVDCPEGSYQILMDLYMCLRSEVPATPTGTVVVDQGVTVEVPNGWSYAASADARASYVIAGPDGVTVAGAILPGGKPDIAQLAPAFSALGLATPSRIDSREKTSAAEVWFFPKGEFAGAAIAMPERGKRRVVLVTGAPDALDNQLDPVLRILGSTTANDHQRKPLSDFFPTDGQDIRVRVEQIGDRNVGVPDGWKVVVRRSQVGALLTTEGGTGLSFGRMELASDAGDSARSVCESTASAWMAGFQTVTILHADHMPDGDMYITLRDGDAQRVINGVRNNADGSYTEFYLGGDRRLFEEHGGVALFIALTSI